MITEKNWSRVEWRYDALRVVNQVLNGFDSCIWDFWDLVWGIRNMFASQMWSLVWTPRETNMAADKAAKLAVQSNVEFCFDVVSTKGLPSAFMSLVLFQDEVHHLL